MRLKDKVAIITGGSSGIGFAVAKAYLKEGAKVVIASFDKDEVLSSVKELDSLNVLGTVCDVKKTEDVKRVVSETLDKFGRIDILVNNAGITNSGLTENVSDEDFINIFTSERVFTLRQQDIFNDVEKSETSCKKGR